MTRPQRLDKNGPAAKTYDAEERPEQLAPRQQKKQRNGPAERPLPPKGAGAANCIVSFSTVLVFRLAVRHFLLQAVFWSL